MRRGVGRNRDRTEVQRVEYRLLQTEQRLRRHTEFALIVEGFLNPFECGTGSTPAGRIEVCAHTHHGRLRTEEHSAPHGRDRGKSGRVSAGRDVLGLAEYDAVVHTERA